MEESAKRKQRLEAMRMDAAQTGVNNASVDSSEASHSLSNPLIEGPPSMNLNQSVASRFNYYTDPTSAFSGNKMGSKVSHQPSPDYLRPPRAVNPDMAFSPACQAPRTNYSPDPRMFQGSVYHSSGPYGIPIRTPNSFSIQQSNANNWAGSRGSANYCFPSNLSPGGNTPSPGFRQGGGPDPRMFQGNTHHSSGPYGSPMGNPKFLDTPQGNYNPWGGSSGLATSCFSSNLSPGVNLPSPNYIQGGSSGVNYSHGRGYRFNNNPQAGSSNRNSPYPNRGRGRSYWLDNSRTPGSVAHGRRVDGRDFVSAELRPDLFYNKTMVEDPWKKLEPVIWRAKDVSTSCDTLESLKAWLPKSITAKKARVTEVPNKHKSEQSLAQFLAASIHDVMNKPENEA